MVPIDVYTTHIYPWSAAEAAATPVPVPAVGGGSCVPRVLVAVVFPLGELLVPLRPHCISRPPPLSWTPYAFTHAHHCPFWLYRDGGRATAHHKTNKHEGSAHKVPSSHPLAQFKLKISS